MDCLECSVHFVTLMQTGYDELNTAVTFYHDRTHFDDKQRNLYDIFAEDFHLNQGRHFVLHNRKATTPNKMTRLKDQIKEFDALFASHADPNQAVANEKDQAVKSGVDKLKWNFLKTNKSSMAWNDLYSFFSSCLHTNVAKTLWLAPNRILLVMQDGQLVWIVIDTISGDIIKILLDKSLSAQFGPKDANRLSGRVICDAAILESPECYPKGKSEIKRPQMVIAYSDQSKVDLITFGKSAAFYQSIFDVKDHKLEKLSAFDPVLQSTFEFACPTVFRIEKRISLKGGLEPGTCNGTLAVWWPNEGQIAWSSNSAESANDAISLLERDDLRNNIIVVSTNLSEKNLLEYMFKSDGLLLSLTYLDERTLVAVEQSEVANPKPKYTVSVFRYSVPNEEPQKIESDTKLNRSMKMKLISFDLSSRIATSEQVKVANKFIVMLALDQTLFLYELSRNLVHRHKLNQQASEAPVYFHGIEWLVDDLLFSVYDVNGTMKVFDVSFNQINLGYMTRYSNRFQSLGEHLALKLFQPFDVESKSSVWELASYVAQSQSKTAKNVRDASPTSRPTPTNRFIGVTSYRKTFTDSLWCTFHFAKGPFGLFRLALPDGFNCVTLTNHYIKCSQVNRPQKEGHYLNYAVKLLHSLDWDTEAAMCLACLSRVMNYILSGRVSFDSEAERLAELALSSFYKPPKALHEQTIYEHKHQLSRYARRFFYKLLDNDRLSKAYLLAVDIGAKDLFNDLYYCSLDKDEYQLAEICRRKYHEIVSEEQEEKRKTELNRSVTAIDDNISNVESAFDKYSVSSSENESVSDEEDEDLTDFDQAHGKKRDLGEVLDALINRKTLKQPLIQTDARKLPVMMADKSLETNRFPKTYSEQELEEYAEKLYRDTKFIYELQFDNII